MALERPTNTTQHPHRCESIPPTHSLARSLVCSIVSCRDSYGEDLTEQAIHLACQANVVLASFARRSIVHVGEEVVAEQRIVQQRLQDTVHETRVAEIDQSTEAFRCGGRWQVHD